MLVPLEFRGYYYEQRQPIIGRLPLRLAELTFSEIRFSFGPVECGSYT